MKLTLPELFIFDMDGLMFDTERLFMKFIIETAKDYGYIFTEKLYIKTVGTNNTTTKEIILSELGNDYPFHEISAIAKKKIIDYMLGNSLPVKPGLTKLLKFIEEKGTPCCVASSTDAGHINQYLDNTNLSKYFSHIIGGDMVTKSKPSPEIFIKACEHYNVAPSQALVLEDSYNGIVAAHAANIPAVCVPDLVTPNEFMINNTVAILNTLDELIPLFT